MPATLPMLYASAKRLPRKQHIDQSDVNFGGDILKQVVPYKGMNMVAFSFTVPGLTEFVSTRSGRKIGPIPHNEIIAFMDCEILQQEQPPENEKEYFQVNYKGDNYWIKKIDANRQNALVRCSCFTGDTKILLANGTCEELRNLVGKEFNVISYNGDFESAFAGNCSIKQENAEIIELLLSDDTTIRCTPDHIFYLTDESIEQACNLQGKSLLNKEGKQIMVKDIVKRPNEDVYCITVPEYGNFCLENGAVVKNCSDFFYTWAYADFRGGTIWGRPPKKYIRKTPNPPQGRPFRNERNIQGYCKHIFYIWRNYMQARYNPNMFV